MIGCLTCCFATLKGKVLRRDFSRLKKGRYNFLSRFSFTDIVINSVTIFNMFIPPPSKSTNVRKGFVQASELSQARLASIVTKFPCELELVVYIAEFYKFQNITYLQVK